MPADRPPLRSWRRAHGPWPRWLPWVLAAGAGSPCLLCVGVVVISSLGQWAGVLPPPPPRAATVTATRIGSVPRFAVIVVADRGFRVGEDYRLVVVAEGRTGNRGLGGVPQREVVYPQPLGLTADAAVTLDWTVDQLKDRPGPYYIRIDRYVDGRSVGAASDRIYVP